MLVDLTKEYSRGWFKKACEAMCGLPQPRAADVRAWRYTSPARPCPCMQERKLAVDGLSLGIGAGECFGLLGVNGAGKTTTFKMMTGDHAPTSGDALMEGSSVLTQLNDVREVVGYCPQFDALLPRMTARETLEMYAMLRGVPAPRAPRAASEMIALLDLTSHCDRWCGTYSGGNKRKLSTGMALIGDPPIVLLDEPTSGVDPATRRFLWDVLARVCVHRTERHARERTQGRAIALPGICNMYSPVQMTRAGRCVVLTSHSMEECEALCTRLTIMVGGRMRCIGSLQHLKERFGQGFTAMVKMPPGHATDDVKAFVLRTFPGAELAEEHQGLMNFQIPKVCACLAWHAPGWASAYMVSCSPNYLADGAAVVAGL
jgi:ABC-type multidrug transport system ATPase subunit